ncbi:MAG: response regulator, partial [Anaerolineales bacterium]
DLLIADIRLPGMSGVELVQKMRRRYPDLKILLITGMKDEKLEQVIPSLRVQGFFQKPLDVPAFLEAVRTILEELPETEREFALNTVETEEGPPVRLSDILAGLRKNLSAQAVILLDERGRAVVVAGDYPVVDFETAWVPLLMAVQSATAKVTRLLDPANARCISVWQGKDFNLFLSPVADLALVLVLKGEDAARQLDKALQETMKVYADVLTCLTEMGVIMPSEVAAEAPPEAIVQALSELEEATPEEAQKDLEALFAQSAFLKREEADAFWEAAVSDLEANFTSSDALSYDEARRLGLTPPESES